MRFYPLRRSRSVRENPLPTVQHKGITATAILRDNRSPSNKIHHSHEWPIRSLIPGHNNAPGAYLTFVHIVSLGCMEKGRSYPLRPPLFRRFCPSFGSFAFRQARQFEHTRVQPLIRQQSKSTMNHSFVCCHRIDFRRSPGKSQVVAFCYIARSNRLTISTRWLRPNFQTIAFEGQPNFSVSVVQSFNSFVQLVQLPRSTCYLLTCWHASGRPPLK